MYAHMIYLSIHIIFKRITLSDSDSIQTEDVLNSTKWEMKYVLCKEDI